MGFVPSDKIPHYFTVPQQVKFWDEGSNCWLGGIAYCDEIICGCCGCTIDLDNFFDLEGNVLTHKDASYDDDSCLDIMIDCPNLMAYVGWADLDEVIRGK